MRKIGALILSLCLTTLSVSAQVPAVIIQPHALGQPHVCGREYYPESLASHGVDGATTVEFLIESDGTVSYAMVVDSSGNKELDDRVLACVKTWKYAPETVNGIPAQTIWGSKITFSADAPFAPQPRIGKPVAVGENHSCLDSAYPQTALQTCKGGVAGISLFIKADGSVDNAKITESTGDTSLDEASLKCVSGWRYAPQTDGFDWTVKVWWRPSPDKCPATHQ